MGAICCGFVVTQDWRYREYVYIRVKHWAVIMRELQDAPRVSSQL